MVKEIETLFHYCSLDTFIKIISNRTIRLFDISKSNDSLELIAFKNELTNKILETHNQYLKEILSKLNSRQGEVKKYIHEKEECEKCFSQTIDFLKDETIQLLKTWCICFSEEGDLLSQWRGYADDAKGIAIGFSKEYFNSLHTYVSLEPLITVKFDKVFYFNDEIRKILDEKTDLNLINADSNAEEITSILNSTLSVASCESPFYKKNSFSEEKEWRLAISDLLPIDIAKAQYLPSLKKINSLIFPLEIRDCSYISKNDSLVSYLEIYLHNIKNAISKIVIGPKSKCTITEIRQFLIFYGLLDNEDDYSIKVYKSESSYR